MIIQGKIAKEISLKAGILKLIVRDRIRENLQDSGSITDIEFRNAGDRWLSLESQSHMCVFECTGNIGALHYAARSLGLKLTQAMIAEPEEFAWLFALVYDIAQPLCAKEDLEFVENIEGSLDELILHRKEEKLVFGLVQTKDSVARAWKIIWDLDTLEFEAKVFAESSTKESHVFSEALAPFNS